MRTLLGEDAVTNRIVSFLRPRSLFTSIALCSSNMRQATFCAWIHDAMEHFARLAAQVTMPITIADLQAMDANLDSAHAAEIYMFIVSQNEISSANQSDARIIMAARAACRTVISRCLAREVGFHSQDNFNARLHELFDQEFVVEDDQIFAKVLGAFFRDTVLFEIPHTFHSHQSGRRWRASRARAM